MVLRSVELFGFKSFADRSRMEFGEGVSALLGPNGCGKSNIVDAVKWVLGEQGTKSLRADRMEDVIFNGTDARKAVNVSEVTLILENADGVLPIDFQEVSVKRRLYRSGESEYFINGSPVKLKDVRELFYDTGIGKSAYSIMEQGKIDQILSNKPEERRHIFEEAAAITKYKVRGKEAERKLERTEDNMRQVENILGEVKRSYDTLQKQSQKTLRYRELKSERFEVERDLQLLRLKGFLDEKRKKEQRLAGKTEERDTLKKEIDGINESLEENLDKVNSMETELMEAQKQLYSVEVDKSNRDHQIGMFRERQEEIRAIVAKYPDGRRRKTPLRLAAGRGFSAFFSALGGVYGTWIELGAEKLKIRELRTDGPDRLEAGPLLVETTPTVHRPESIAFRVTDAAGHAAVYSGDTDYSENLVRLAGGADVFVCESALPDELKAEGHLTPSEAGDMAARAGVKTLVLTHLYPECDAVDIVGQCRRRFNGNIIVASDLMRLPLG